MTHYLFYTERCTPKIREFENESALFEFAGRFIVGSLGNPDNFIDHVVRGTLVASETEVEKGAPNV